MSVRYRRLPINQGGRATLSYDPLLDRLSLALDDGQWPTGAPRRTVYILEGASKQIPRRIKPRGK